jgi:tetratricopeptide (TPR) repeat protein
MPNNADAYYNLGLAWANLGSPKKAELCRQRAIQIRDGRR